MTRRLFAPPALALGALVACSGLKTADAPADPTSEDSGVPGDVDGATPAGDAGADGASDPDAGAPPTDFECGGEAWTKATKGKPECAPRQVKIVDPEIAIDVNEISIARTPAGRIGIAYNHEIDGISGEMRLAHFVPTTSSFTPAVQKRAKGPFDHAGFVTRVAASAPDKLHVVAHDVDDVTQSGEIVVVELAGGAPPFSDPETVMTGVAGGIGKATPLAIAVHGSDTIVTARVETGGAPGAPVAKLAARRRTGAGAFTALPDVVTNLTPADAPSTASTSLLADATGQLHLLYHHCEVPQHSTPRYHTLDGSVWSYRKTVDNAVLDGLSGFSPRVGTYGNRKFAAYFFRKALQGAPATADLRLATWLGTGDVSVEVLDQSIPSPDALYPAYRVAMAVDPWGLVHLAIVRPSPSTDKGYLEYKRQTRTTDGKTKWLSDIVDPDVLSTTSGALVDLVVDGAGRPHIAYLSGVDLKVRYATRFDRP